MIDAPERIWIEQDDCPYFYEESELMEVGSPVTEYVRADLYAALEAQLAEARKVLEPFAELEAALDRIANVVGEDEPSIMWPWAQEIARSALQPAASEGRQQAQESGS